MKIVYYGHTIELNDDLIEKHGKMASYCYCKTKEDLERCLRAEIAVALSNEMKEQNCNVEDHLIEKVMFERYNDRQISNIIEKQFQIELDVNGF